MEELSYLCEEEDIQGIMDFLDCTEDEAIAEIEAYNKRFDSDYPVNIHS